MKSRLIYRLAGVAFLVIFGMLASGIPARAQSGRVPPSSGQKKNKRPDDANQGGEQAPPDIVGKPNEADAVKINTALVNVDAVVYNKKSGQIITGLKKENFALYVDGAKQDISNFSTPDAPLTLTMLLEYSKLTDYLNGDRFDYGPVEVLRPMALFLSQFIKPPNDYVSVVAYDMRPTPLTDFTNDPHRLNEVINLLFHNLPASREANLYDALKMVLLGGRADSVVLEDSKEEKTEYAGLTSIPGRRKAIFLVCSGVDTFSKITYSQARKIAQNAGIPIYIIGTGNLFFKKYADNMRVLDSLGGTPGRMTLLQAQNALQTFARETGGRYFPVTFEGELPSVLQSINALLRNQYSLGFMPKDPHDGKQHKIVVKVDVPGNGNFDDKSYIVQSREIYNAPKS